MSNLPYVQAVSETTQTITTANTPQVIIIDLLDDANEFSLDTATGIITYNKIGDGRKYTYIVAPQVFRGDTCEDEIPNFRCWIQKKASEETEFVDVPFSNVLINVNRHRMTKDVLVLNGLITLEAGDKIRFMMSADVDGLVGIETIPMTGEPDIASVIVSVFNIGLEKDEPQP